MFGFLCELWCGAVLVVVISGRCCSFVIDSVGCEGILLLVLAGRAAVSETSVISDRGNPVISMD